MISHCFTGYHCRIMQTQSESENNRVDPVAGVLVRISKLSSSLARAMLRASGELAALLAAEEAYHAEIRALADRYEFHQDSSPLAAVS